MKKHKDGPDKALEWAERDAGPLPDVGNKAAVSTIMKAMAVPKRYRQELLTSEIKRTAAMMQVWDWHRSEVKENWALMLAGPTDTGKSYAAAYWLFLKASKMDSKALNNGNWRAWYRANDLSSLDRKEQRAMWTTPYLVLDDLGTEYAAESGYYLSAIYSIICNRYDECRQTIFTSNLSYDQLIERYDDPRIIRRLRDHGQWCGLSNKNKREWA